MKNLYILAVALFLNLTVTAQSTVNEIASNDYNQIKVNGVLFSIVKNTHGEENALSTLFGTAIDIQNHPDGLGDGWKKLNFNNIVINFDDVNSNSSSPELTYLSTNTFEVLDIVINVGDNISTLLFGANFTNNLNVDGSTSVIITNMNGDCCPFIIKYNNLNIITSIEYFVWS